MSYITVNVDVDVDLYEIDTEDLVEELQRRGKSVPDKDGIDPSDNHLLVQEIYQLKRLGKDYSRQLDDLIYNVVGRIL
jgi:hypothetical protein